MSAYNLTTLLDAVSGRLDAHYTLTYVDYRDQLSDDQVAMLVRGDWESLWDSVETWESDSRYESARQIIHDLTVDVLNDWRVDADAIEDDAEREAAHAALDAIEDDGWDADEFETLRFDIYDRDDSNVIRDLARNTSSVLLRIPLADGDTEPASEVDPSDLLRRIGMDATEGNVTAVYDILAECGDYVTPFALVAVSPSIFVDLGPRETGTMTIKDPHLFLTNVYAGDGYEEGLTGDLTVPLADVMTDEDAPGYSWQTIAGVYVSAYEADVTINQPEEVAA